METQLRLLLFAVGEERYGVRIAHVRSVERLGKLNSVPRTPPFIAGVMTVRNEVIPIIDLRQRLGFAPQPPTPQARVIIVEMGEIVAGLWVDRVIDLVEVAQEAVSTPPPLISETAGRFVEGAVLYREEPLILLDLSKTLQPTETAALSAMMQQELSSDA